MSEYTKEVIKEMVDNFMRAYATEVEKNGLGPARLFADQYLADLSKDMPSEAADNFTAAAVGPLNSFLQGHIDASETASQELTEDMATES